MTTPFKVIRLHGWIHTDDRKALIEIFRQFNVNTDDSEEILKSPVTRANIILSKSNLCILEILWRLP